MSAFTLSSSYAVANASALVKSRGVKARASRRAAIAPKAAVKVGDAAPDFTLMGPGFELTTLSKLKGQKVCLAFFPAAYSGDADGGCECQLGALKSISETDGVTVLGISKDTPFTMAPWSAKVGFTCLSDPSLATSEKYVGTFDLGKFLDDIDVSTNFAPYVTSNRGCVVLDETGKVVYVWNSPGEPGMLPDTTEIQAALGIGKTNFA